MTPTKKAKGSLGGTTCWRQRQSPRQTPTKKQPTRRSRRKHTSKPDVSTSDEGDEIPSDAGLRWKRFRRPALPRQQQRLLVKHVKLRDFESRFDAAQWLCFVDRVAREYLYLHGKQKKKDPMHLHREAVLYSAMAVVATQVKPAGLRPANSDLPELVKAVQPTIEHTFDLCGSRAEEKTDSQMWVDAKLKSGDYTYRDMCNHSELLDAYVSKKIAEAVAAGSPDGLLVLKEGEKPPGPDELYVLSSQRVGRRRATASGCYSVGVV